MRLVPLTVEAAIAGLVRTATRTLEMATPPPALELTDDGPSLAARVKFEVRCVRIILRQLEHLPIADLGTIPLYRRAQVDVVHLVALLGEGVLALDCLAFLLASDAEADDADAQSAASWARERAEELVDALWRLQEFRTSMWLLLNVLQSPYATGVPDSLASLRTAVSCLMDGDSKVAKRLRDSDLYTLHLRNSVQLRKRTALDPPSRGANVTLADMDSVVSATVPVCSGDLLDPLPYVFEGVVSVDQEADAPRSPSSSSSDSSFNSPIPTPASSPSRSTKDHGPHAFIRTLLVPSTGDKMPSPAPPVLKVAPPASCAFVFHLRQTTPTMILHLFQHALAISPRFKTHELPDLFNPPDPSQLLRQQQAKQKVRPPHDIVAKFRLHNLSNAQREPLSASSAAEEEAVQSRLQKQQKLRGLSDHQLRRLCVEVYDELVRRNIVDNWLKALVDSGTGGGEGGYMVGGPNVRQEDVEVAPVAGASSSSPPGLESSLGVGRRSQANKTLVGMEDGKFLELCGDACWELRRRDVEAKAVAGEADIGGEFVGVEVEKGKAGGDTESRLPDDGDSDDSEDTDDHDEEEDCDHQDGNQLQSRKESTDLQLDEESERATLQEEDAEMETEDAASDYDDVDDFWKKAGARRNERMALRESFLEKKQEIEIVVLKYVSTPEPGHTR